MDGVCVSDCCSLRFSCSAVRIHQFFKKSPDTPPLVGSSGHNRPEPMSHPPVGPKVTGFVGSHPAFPGRDRPHRPRPRTEDAKRYDELIEALAMGVNWIRRVGMHLAEEALKKDGFTNLRPIRE